MNSFRLKLIALITMTFDHICHFSLGTSVYIPQWFRIIGRISAPIFIFCVAEGYAHTRSKTAYLKRLYLWAVSMGFSNLLINKFIIIDPNKYIPNNIFAMLFCIISALYIIELNKTRGSEMKTTIINVIALLWVSLYVAFDNEIIKILFPNPIFAEGGIILFLFGLAIYYSRQSKIKLGIIYTIFSLFYLSFPMESGAYFNSEDLVNVQWLQMLALPIILAYNGEKGRSMKYLFYIFYPLHIYALALMFKPFWLA